MNENGVYVKYGKIAPTAKENFEPETEQSEFDTLKQLKEYRIDFPNYSNPCELYRTVLDGRDLVLPSDSENSNLGLWSNIISDENGEFEHPIILTLESKEKFSVQGMTFTFDVYNDIFATQMEIKWYYEKDLLSQKVFTPNSSTYTCENGVVGFNKIEITFFSINMPHNRLRLVNIDYGYSEYFLAEDIKSIKIIEEINPISTEIVINSADLELKIENGENYKFQKKQPLSIYQDGKLLSTQFITSSKRKDKNIWSISTEDYIGVLEDITFYGGIYEKEKAINIINSISKVSHVPFVVDEKIGEEKVTGRIPYTNCREALMLVCFAIQAVVDTSRTDVVKIRKLGGEEPQKIPLNRIIQGQNFDDEDEMTSLVMNLHLYEESDEIVDLYDSSKDGFGENILIIFSDPIGMITEQKNIDIIERSANHALINSKSDGVLKGKKYNHKVKTYIKRNNNVLADQIQKEVRIENATLSGEHFSSVLNSCYDYLVATRSINQKIVERNYFKTTQPILYGYKKYGNFKYQNKPITEKISDDPIHIGDKISTQTEYYGELEGIVIKQTFNLDRGIIIKDCVIKEANI